MVVLSEPLKQRVLALLADEYARNILRATMVDHKSVLELARQLDIPMSTVYRRIQELRNAELLAAKSRRTDGGKSYDVYGSLVKQIDVSFGKEFRVHVAPKEMLPI